MGAIDPKPPDDNRKWHGSFLITKLPVAEEVFPRSLRQRCLAHKIRNLQSKVRENAKSLQTAASPFCSRRRHPRDGIAVPERSANGHCQSGAPLPLVAGVVRRIQTVVRVLHGRLRARPATR